MIPLSKSSFREDLSKQQALRAALARLDAEAHGHERVVFPEAIVAERPELVERETSLFEKRAADLLDQVSTIESSLRLATEELAMTVPLVEKQVVSKVDQLRLEREVVVTRGELNKLTAGFRRDAMEEFNTTKAEIERLDESLSGRRGPDEPDGGPITGERNRQPSAYRDAGRSDSAGTADRRHCSRWRFAGRGSPDPRGGYWIYPSGPGGYGRVYGLRFWDIRRGCVGRSSRSAPIRSNMKSITSTMI